MSSPGARPARAVGVTRARATPFPIVGIGASAGGLEAFKQLLEHLPLDLGMGFVLVPHLDPSHHSLLTDLLSRATKLSIEEVKNGRAVEPNHIYVIPPNTYMVIERGVLKLTPRKKFGGQPMPIDFFLRSLAEDRAEMAIGIILSGSASDGALGIEAIKSSGGMTFAQDEQTARYPGMPHSAVATGRVDFVLPPAQIAAELARIAVRPLVGLPAPMEPAESFFPKSGTALATLFKLLKARTGVDFSLYKEMTIKRRTWRRMTLHHMENLWDYVRLCEKNSGELDRLYQELLVMVTGFFRDPKVFDVLRKKVYPAIVGSLEEREPIRLWVPGCATGEEVYSLAISLVEFVEKKRDRPQIQIFATDISDAFLSRARAGVYVENIAMDVSTDRLRRFFTKVDAGYQVNKSIRELCIFAKQDLTKDPPFSKLNLISCRNLLIYFGAMLQRRIGLLFNYALKPKGFLLLGTAENMTGLENLFAPVDTRSRIFSRKMRAANVHLELTRSGLPAIGSMFHGRAVNPGGEVAQTEAEIVKDAEQIVLSKFTPPSVLINQDFEIVQFRGNANRFFAPASGRASLHVFKMAREGLMADLRAALRQASKSGAAVEKRNVGIKLDGKPEAVDLRVVPIRVKSTSLYYYLVLFDERGERGRLPLRSKKRSNAEEAGRTKELKLELESTRDNLQSIIEEQEATNEELKAANEEILSSNEELQSTNEEAETAKEELQSTNEELMTLNEEVQQRNAELSHVNSDLVNLLAAVNLPVIILGADMRIRKFTAPAEKLMNLIPTDVGRPIGDIKMNVDIPDLDRLVAEVIETVTLVEQEVRDKKGNSYSMRIRPYKTPDNKIEGAIIVFLDITHAKGAVMELESAHQHLNTVLELLSSPVIILDSSYKVVKSNSAFTQVFKMAPEETIGRSIYELGGGVWDIPPMRIRLEKAFAEDKGFFDFELQREFPRVGEKTLLVHARLVAEPGKEGKYVFLAVDDVTERTRAERATEASIGDKADVFLGEIHHRVKNNLQIISSLLNLQAGYVKDQDALRMFRESQDRVRSMAMIHEKLYQSKALTRIDFADYTKTLVRDLFASNPEKSRNVSFSVEAEDAWFDIGIAVPCGLIINELVSNALTHAFPADGSKKAAAEPGKVRVSIRASEDDEVTIVVSDTGAGLPKSVDVGRAETLGLRIVRSLTDQLGGELHAKVAEGTEWTLRFRKKHL